MMVVVDSLYPDCTVNTGDIANTLAATHFQIGASGFHSGGTPDGAQSNATPFTVVSSTSVVLFQCQMERLSCSQQHQYLPRLRYRAIGMLR